MVSCVRERQCDTYTRTHYTWIMNRWQHKAVPAVRIEVNSELLFIEMIIDFMNQLPIPSIKRMWHIEETWRDWYVCIMEVTEKE